MGEDVTAVVNESTLALPKNEWMQQGAAAVGIASISAISSANCNRCSGHFRGDMVTAARSDSDLRRRAWNAPRRCRSRDSRAHHRRSRVLRDVAVSDGRVESRSRRPIPAVRHEHDCARDRAGIEREAFARPKSAPCCRRLDHRLDERDGRRKLRNTASPRRKRERPPRAVRRTARGVSAVRVPEYQVLSEFGSTSCKALWPAKTAANLLIISSVTEHVVCNARFHRLAVNDLRRESSDACR